MNQLRRCRELKQFMLQAKDGEIGSIEELYFDDKSWNVRYLIVNTGSWLFGRRVLLAPIAVKGLEDTELVIRINLTREQIETCPPVDAAKPISRTYETEYYRHFGWAPYWQPGPTQGTTPFVYPTTPQLLVNPAPIKEDQIEHPHLRSSAEVAGYSIQASDGAVGHVEDEIVDDKRWVVQYLEVDTRNWLPGKKVLVAPAWIDQVSWGDQSVSLSLSREVIESAPAYDNLTMITPEYEAELIKHYEKSRS